MPVQVTPVAPGLTGFATCAVAGFVAGISYPGREGWLVHAGTVTELAPGVAEVIPGDVNDAGVLVGKIGDATDGTAFLYDGQLHDLQPQLGTSIGEARDITTSGVVVGARARVAEPRRAFRLDTRSGDLTVIPFAAGLPEQDYVTSLAVAVTPDGRYAVGLAGQAYSVAVRGFLYDHEAGVTTDLGPRLFPRAMSKQGLVAGSDPTTGEVVTYDIATGVTQRRGVGLVEAVNADGVVVGSMNGSHPDFPTTPFFGRPGQPLVDAGALTTAGGLRFSSVSDVTDEGLLVGSATVVDPATGGPVKGPTGGRQFVPATVSIN